MTLLLLAPLPVLAQPANCPVPPGVPGVGGMAVMGVNIAGNLAGRAAAAVGGHPAAPAAQPATSPPATPPPAAPSALGTLAAGASTFLTLPLAVPLAIAGNACHDHPRPHEDVLHGEPGDVLRGPHSADLLRGPGQPHVKVSAPQPVKPAQ